MKPIYNSGIWHFKYSAGRNDPFLDIARLEVPAETVL